MEHAAVSAPAVRIRPPRPWGDLRLRELWEYRELVYFLAKREIQVRYKQSVFGVSWAVLQPVALAFVFTVFFSNLAKVPSENLPYAVFALAGLVPWLFTAKVVSQGASSLVGDANLLSKVYFPRLVIPIGQLVAAFLDLTISLSVVFIFCLLYGIAITGTAALVPLFLLLGGTTAIGMSVFLAALNVRYRDVMVVVPLMVQMWLFATPVIYPGSLITGKWQYIYAINPMVSVIDGVRWALLGTHTPTVAPIMISVLTALLILGAGVTYFRRTEQFFADVI